MMHIPVVPLSTGAFAPFGDVIDVAGVASIVINQGFAERVNGLAHIDVGAESGEVNVSIFTARTRPQPIAVALMERHPLGSQMFYPLQERPWLVVVCADPRDPASYRAFRASGRQGVNYRRNTWHHPLLVEGDDERFLVIDRAGPGANLEECAIDPPHFLDLTI